VNIEQIDKWLKDQYGISYTEMSNEFNSASELLSKKIKEIERLNKELQNLEKLNNANYQSFIEVNNIINELEKYIVIEMNSFGICNASDIYYKLQQLKGEDKE